MTKTYTAESKLQAVRMVADQHFAVAEVARRIGVAECQCQWPVAWLCDAFDVSPVGYYALRDRPISLAERRRWNLLGAMSDIHAEVCQCCGNPTWGRRCSSHPR